MKMIKSFMIIATTLGASTVVFAQKQEVKAEIAKPVVNTVPAPGSKPALAPDMKPEIKAPLLQQSDEAPLSAPAPTPQSRKSEPGKAPILKAEIATDVPAVITQPVILPTPPSPKTKEN